MLSEPKDFLNFTHFSLGYMETEKKASHINAHEPRFGGHQTLEEREQSFFAVNQTVHCGFVRAAEGFPSTGFDLKEEDRKYMSVCRVAVSSCIFGSSDFLRRPTSRLVMIWPTFFFIFTLLSCYEVLLSLFYYILSEVLKHQEGLEILFILILMTLQYSTEFALSILRNGICIKTLVNQKCLIAL